MGWFNAPKPVVGLDIGSRSIKLVELKRSKNSYQLLKLGKIDLPPETIVDGALMNTSQISDAITDLIQSCNIKTKDVVCSISGHAVIIKKILMPTMPLDELEEQIQWEAEQYIPFDINDVYVDVQIVNAAEGEEDSEQMEVILVAAKKDLIHDYTSVVSDAGLNPVVMDVDAFAMENMFLANYQIEPDQTVALIDLGASVSTINVLKSGVSTFTRDIAIGGHLYTEEIQKQLSISYDEAESLKLDPEGAGADTAQAEQIQSILDSISENICSEIQRSLDFFTATAPENPVQKIYLSGGCARVQGLQALLKQNLNIDVEIINPFIQLTNKSKDIDPILINEIGPAAAVGIGLALRHAGDKRS